MELRSCALQEELRARSARTGSARARGIALAAAVAGLTGCGGRDGSSQSLTGAVEAGAQDAQANGTDGSTDPCVTSQAFDFQPIMSFGQNQGSDIGGPATGYVSYDGTGGATSCEPDLPEDGGMFGCQMGSLCDLAGNNVETLFTGFMGCNTGFAAQSELLPPAFDRCGDKFALHLRATNLSGWGMNLGIELRQNTGCSTIVTPAIDASAGPDASVAGSGLCWFDATSWTGISFWARLGSNDSAMTALMTIGDPLTSSNLGSAAPFNDILCGDPACGTPNGVTAIPCAMSPCTDKGTCCDPFGKGVALSSDWQFYMVPFSDMKQKGFGLAEAMPDLKHFLGVKFNMSKGQLGVADFDVWVDNFAFYRSK